MTDVSNNELLGVLLSVEHRLGEINGTLLGMKEAHQTERLHQASIELAQNSKHDTAAQRLQKLEQYRWMQTGAAGAIGAILTALFGGHTPKWPFSW